MPEKYFEKFNQIYYANTLSINIMERAVVLNSVKNNPYAFYPMDINNNARPDQVADRYYDDQYLSWLIYFTNNMTDPYYDWYLSEEDLDKTLLKKYRCPVYLLQEKVKFYRNNWTDPNNSVIEAATFDGLTNDLKKYWVPVYGENGRVYSYTRKQQDWTVNTNFIVRYATDGSNLIGDEIVHINFDGDNFGRAQVLTSNSTSLTVQHVYGTVLPNTEVVITGSSYVYGTESMSNSVFTSAASVANNLSLEEYVYWEPVSIYDYENELNSSNKSINLLDNRFATGAATQLKKLLK